MKNQVLHTTQIALDVRPRLAGNTAGSGRGPWYLARSNAADC